jgi:hypothetical protein
VHDAPAPRPEAFPTEDELAHVTTALSDARWIAAWNDTHVFVSKDGGRTFARVLDGPGTVNDVAFDCFGRVLVLRAHTLGIHDTSDHWRTLDWLVERQDPATLIGGGPDAIVLGATENGQLRVAISGDLGASWRYHDLRSYWDERRTSARQDADGTIHIANTFADCMSDPMQWYVIAHDEVRDEPGVHDAEPGPFYARGDVAYSGYGWRRRGESEWRAITGLPDDNAGHMLTGPVARTIAGGRIYRLGDGVATSIRTVPETVDVQAVDLAGRFWGLERGELRAVGPHEPPTPID